MLKVIIENKQIELDIENINGEIISLTIFILNLTNKKYYKKTYDFMQAVTMAGNFSSLYDHFYKCLVKNNVEFINETKEICKVKIGEILVSLENNNDFVKINGCFENNEELMNLKKEISFIKEELVKNRKEIENLKNAMKNN